MKIGLDVWKCIPNIILWCLHLVTILCHGWWIKMLHKRSGNSTNNAFNPCPSFSFFELTQFRIIWVVNVGMLRLLFTTKIIFKQNTIFLRQFPKECDSVDFFVLPEFEFLTQILIFRCKSYCRPTYQVTLANFGKYCPKIGLTIVSVIHNIVSIF